MSDTTSHGSRGKTIVDGVSTAGGAHCETTALGVLLRHAGLQLSEPMLFGLGCGLSFIYWDSKQQKLPFMGGRANPFVLTQNLTTRLGLPLRVHETTSARKAWDQVRASIDHGKPVGLQLDSHDLEYFGSRVHFAGHVVAIYGYDGKTAYLVDTAQQGGAVTTSLESLANARAARGPMSARHRSFTIEAAGSDTPVMDLAEAILPAIAACAAEFLHPPIANVGNRGILTASRRVPSWFSRVEDPHHDLVVIATLMERAGTGGALFRNLYRDFLTECLDLLDDTAATNLVERGRDLFAESAVLWTATAQLIERASATGNSKHLSEASQRLEQIAAIETDAMSSLCSLNTSGRGSGRAA